MKAFLEFFKSHKKGFIATLCAFVIAIATAVSCGVVFSDKPEHPLESSLAAETITPRNSGNWTDAGNYADSFAGGTGTEADPYLISTGAELAKLAVDVNNGTNYSGQYFKLTTNIDLLDYYWTPIGSSSSIYFAGNFDGGGNELDGMIISSTADNVGLFGYVKPYSSITIKRLSIKNSCISGQSSYIGGIIGYVYTLKGNLTLDSVSFSGEISGSSFIGGIVGYIGGENIVSTEADIIIYIKNCKAEGNITGTSSVGGCFGGVEIVYTSRYTEINLTDCSSSCNIVATSAYNAGVVGEIEINNSIAAKSKVNINGCYNTGSLLSFSTAGGVVGRIDTKTCGEVCIQQCYNTGDLISDNSSSSAGGIVYYANISNRGTSGIKINDCYNTGNIVVQGGYTAGCVGDIRVAVSTLSTVKEYVEIVGTHNKGSITANGYYVGGLIGHGAFSGSDGGNSILIKNCFNTGDLTVSKDYVGGLVGWMQCVDGGSGGTKLNVVNSFNSGNITSSIEPSTNTIGGLVGYAESWGKGLSQTLISIENCFNAGNHILLASRCQRCFGGIIGYADIKNLEDGNYSSEICISKSYNSGNVSAGYNTLDIGGGIIAESNVYNENSVGVSRLKINNCFNVGNLKPQPYDCRNRGIIGKCSTSASSTGGAYTSIYNSYYDSTFHNSGYVSSSGSVTYSESGGVANLSSLMKVEANFGTTSFGTYTNESGSTGSAKWSSAWDFSNIWKINENQNNGNPCFLSFLKDTLWEYNAATSFAGGSGTETDPFLISNGAELAKLAIDVDNSTTYEGKYFKLISNIDLSGKKWNPIGGKAETTTEIPTSFCGNFDGAGFKVSGMTVDDYKMYSGLFGAIFPSSGSSVIKNLSVVDCAVNITTGNDICFGTLVALAFNARIENVYTSGSVIIEVTTTEAFASVGGITGTSINTIYNNCYNESNVAAMGYLVCVGGISAQSSAATYNNCGNLGGVSMSISGEHSENSTFILYAGGILGSSNEVTEIENCINKGSVNVYSSGYSCLVGIGGMLGGALDDTLNISGCINIGDIAYEVSAGDGDASIGGMAGQFFDCKDSIIKDSINFGQISCRSTGTTSVENADSKIGGIIGHANSYDAYLIEISNCHNKGAIRQSAMTSFKCGGIIGSSSKNISVTSCSVECNISVSGTGNIGGLIGFILTPSGFTTVTDCYFDGTITNDYVGISDENNSIGGLFGYLSVGQETMVFKAENLYVIAIVEVTGITDKSYINNSIGSVRNFTTEGEYIIQNYFFDTNITYNGSENEISKNYVGATDGTSESFGGDFWFFNDNFRNGELTLKGIYHIGKGIKTTSEENIAKLQALGFTAA